MTKFILAFVISTSVIYFNACVTEPPEPAYSVCVHTLIDSLEAQPVASPPARVEMWSTTSASYIYSTSDCCDFFNYLRKWDCEVICAPDGGITGMGDGNCGDLEIIDVRLIWEDDR